MAIWEKLFSKITFKNYPDTSTPINADNLNAMTDAIDGLDDRVLNILGDMASQYDNTSTYAAGEYVVYDGLLYKCITDISVAEKWDSNKWQKTDCGTEFSTLNSNLENYIMIQETMENCSFPKNVRTVLTPIKPNVEGYNIYLINAKPIVGADLNNMGVNNNTIAFFNPVSNDYSCDVYFVWLLIKKLN